MPNISHDGQSFIIDGQRIWLVSGAIHYSRTPRGLWRKRIQAAKQAGLNCIETYVFWNLHELQPGKFDFEGDKDLRHFVELCAEEDLYVWLRPGPYVCSEWDCGGLPPWLLAVEDVKLREANGPFLEACSRYLGAVMDQVRDLQVTIEGEGGRSGPIIMMQAENEWFCHNPEQGEKYLREIVRYLLEHGCNVPINSCNNLWQRVDGTIDTWNAAWHLASHMRQLRVVQPEAPRVVSEFWTGWFDSWGKDHDTTKSADLNYYRMAATLAVGAQYNLYMFHGGTNFGFFGGRTISQPDCYMTTSYDYDAPLLEAGGRGEKYDAVKRISTFASQFGHVFAHLDPDWQPVNVALLEREDHPMAVMHQTGSQGDVIFLLKSPKDRTKQADVLLPNGLTLSVPIGDDNVAWMALDVNLGGVARLDFTSLRPWAFVGRKLLVLFGPAGEEGVVSIDDTQLPVKVPSGKTPHVEPFGEVVIAVLNREQVDVAYLAGDAVVVGAAGLGEDGTPVPASGWPTMFTIDRHGELSRSGEKAMRRPSAPKLAKWRSMGLGDIVSGEHEGFQPIDGPKSHEALGCGFGYGWYRFDVPRAQSGTMLAPMSGDRLHVYTKGTLTKVLGLGPGATYEPTSLSLSGQVVVLTDNLGRFNYGWSVGEWKGIWDDFYKVKKVKLPKPKIESGRAEDPFVLRGHWNNLRKGQFPVADKLSWTVTPSGRNPLILDLAGFPLRAMVMMNGEPIGMYDPGNTAGLGRWVFKVGEAITGGKNRLTLALFQPFEGGASALANVKVYQTAAPVTGKSKWSFMPWSVPDAAAFDEGRPVEANCPAWHCATFNVSRTDTPLWFEAKGLSKGQLYLNGRNVGRYWVATGDKRPVPPQLRYYLPEPWLTVDGPNELLVFDEHGFAPDAVKLAYDPMGPYGR